MKIKKIPRVYTTIAYNYRQNIRDKQQLSFEMVYYGKNLVSIFKGLFASIDKIFVLGRKLSSRLNLFKCLKFLNFPQILSLNSCGNS